MKLRIKNKISVNSYFEKSIDIYKGLYDQEISNRNRYDNKLSSRLTLLTIQLSLVSILLKLITQNKKIMTVGIVLFVLSFVIAIIQIVSFYKAFFRMKMNYKEIAIEEIRMYHLYNANEKLALSRKNRYKILNDEDIELITYLKDSYLFCAFHNMKINLKRGKALIWFDNCTLINTLILLINYLLIFLNGGSLKWLL